MDIIGYLNGYTIAVAAVVEATGANRNTIKVALQGLVKKGLVAQRGKGRGAHYTQGR